MKFKLYEMKENDKHNEKELPDYWLGFAACVYDIQDLFGSNRSSEFINSSNFWASAEPIKNKPWFQPLLLAFHREGLLPSRFDVSHAEEAVDSVATEAAEMLAEVKSNLAEVNSDDEWQEKTVGTWETPFGCGYGDAIADFGRIFGLEDAKRLLICDVDKIEIYDDDELGRAIRSRLPAELLDCIPPNHHIKLNGNKEC